MDPVPPEGLPGMARLVKPCEYEAVDNHGEFLRVHYYQVDWVPARVHDLSHLSRSGGRPAGITTDIPQAPAAGPSHPDTA